MINKQIILGRLGKDPESRTTQSGKHVVNFTVATDNPGEQPPTWHRVVAWEKLADICASYLNKGSLVYIEGRTVHREWEQDGQRRWTTEVVAYEIKMLGGKRDEYDEQGRPDVRDESTGDSLPF